MFLFNCLPPPLAKAYGEPADGNIYLVNAAGFVRPGRPKDVLPPRTAPGGATPASGASSHRLHSVPCARSRVWFGTSSGNGRGHATAPTGSPVRRECGSGASSPARARRACAARVIVRGGARRLDPPARDSRRGGKIVDIAAVVALRTSIPLPNSIRAHRRVATRAYPGRPIGNRGCGHPASHRAARRRSSASIAFGHRDGTAAPGPWMGPAGDACDTRIPFPRGPRAITVRSPGRTARSSLAHRRERGGRGRGSTQVRFADAEQPARARTFPS